jgi:hypothetical protein
MNNNTGIYQPQAPQMIIQPYFFHLNLVKVQKFIIILFKQDVNAADKMFKLL